MQAVSEVSDAGGDVVAGQPHPFHAVDASLGRLVGVPVLERGARYRGEGCFAAEGDDQVDVRNQLGWDGLRGQLGDQGLDLRPDLVADRPDRVDTLTGRIL
ncbi:hypothetical protein RHDE110596_23060 [Prescottella defluvii]